MRQIEPCEGMSVPQNVGGVCAARSDKARSSRTPVLERGLGACPPAFSATNAIPATWPR